ncbi:MAG: DNA polymerase I [Candidatus Buchananbacteria bacterium]|nr:DNA polymerase I [Candidatus Buchananbacteria bacterium]
MRQKNFVIIDGNALIHRAWHALPPTMITKKGEIINAVYGFTMILLRVFKDLKPDYLAVTFDLKGPTFRHEQYENYKATRVKQADELYDQIPRIKEVVRAFNIPIYEKQGFEADDIIATLVRDKNVEKIKSIIVTGDLDTLQLVDKNTEVYTMYKGLSDTITYDTERVKERYDGLLPEQMVDFKALKGDPSDNIPGVKGIGEKGAINLIKEFKTLENLYKNIESEKISDRYRKLLIEHKDDALMSKKLSQMIDDVNIDFKLEDTKTGDYDSQKVFDLFQQLEFKTLLDKLPKNDRKFFDPTQDQMDFSKTNQPVRRHSDQYQLIDTETKLKKLITELKTQKTIAIDTETSGLDALNAELLGVSLSWQKNEAYYVLAKPELLKILKPILEDEKIKKVGHNIKFDLESLQTAGIDLAGIDFDTMIASYLINPGNRQHGLDSLVFTELGHSMQPITELIGTGKNQITLKQVDVKRVSDYSCEDADFTWQLVTPLIKQLQAVNNLGLLKKIEVPLIPVLAEMETNGIMVDAKFLNAMNKDVTKEIERVEKEIYKISGESFNVASPLQLKKILFEKLEIPTQGIGKTKTGISTAAGQLEKLKNQHPIINKIIDFRELAKLKSTYLEALPKLISPKDGRVHTSFNQTVAATGRLSSSDPNLQNIPIRTELGQQIRKAFVVPKGFTMLSADYSQIELRIIASLANDQKMIAAFKNGEDIHQATAAEINDVPLDKVTKEMRYAAKAVNFGIIYGQGAWGLSETAGIPRAQAQDFIDRYFSAHQTIYDYLEKTKNLAHEEGFTETLLGRRRYFPEINASLQPLRAAAERAAINHPIQGTAADLIKLAMIEIDKQLPTISPKSKMLLQVHDELVFEIPEEEIGSVAKFVKKTMEEIYKLRAPVEAHLSVGQNWGELKKLTPHPKRSFSLSSLSPGRGEGERNNDTSPFRGGREGLIS